MQPLEGLKVLDLSESAAMPTCSMMLADMGAEVIKLEQKRGDNFRWIMSGSIAANINRNKKCISVDIRVDQGKEIASKLIKKSDVFLESFTPGVIERLGFGYDVVNKMNPRIIYCSLSGFGQTGPYRDWKGYDVVAQAMSGMMTVTGEEGRPHVRIGTSLIDAGTGMFCAYAIALALMEREKTGKGQRIDVSLFDTAISWMNYWITYYTVTGTLPMRRGSAHEMLTPYQIFDASDKPVFIGVSTDYFWVEFCNIFNVKHLAEDPRFTTNEKRKEHREEIIKLVAETVKHYTGDEILQKLRAAGIPCAPIFSVADVIQDAHAKARDMLVEIDDPKAGKIVITKTPILMSGERGSIRRPAPMLGEHTVEVLGELGYSKAKIQELIDNGVVVQQGQSKK